MTLNSRKRTLCLTHSLVILQLQEQFPWKNPKIVSSCDLCSFSTIQPPSEKLISRFCTSIMRSMIMLGPPPQPETTTGSSNSLNSLFHGILSYDSNIMLAAIISLLLVILFVLLLHVYAKWFLVQARQRSRRSVSVPQVLGTRFHHFHSFTIDTTFADSPTKGLESSVISAIPLFVYEGDDQLKHALECAICLSLFEHEEVGRRLPKCSHVFHVECIDMWLHSHSTCPICRAPVVAENQGIDSSSFPNAEVTLHNGPNHDPIPSLLEEEISSQEPVLEIIVEVPNPENENGRVKDSVSVYSLSPSSVISSHGRPLHGDSVKKITREQI